MSHRRLEFVMPATAAVVFDAFHHRQWRQRWDSLVRHSQVVGGAPCPYVGAVTENAGRGWLRGLAMRTRFVSFERPHLAAAVMIDRSFPFEQWAASMRHRVLPPDRSLLVYTYSLRVGPASLRWLLEPLVDWVFATQTRRRFRRLQAFLRDHAKEIESWQLNQGLGSTGDLDA
jgi:hypothetical protein